MTHDDLVLGTPSEAERLRFADIASHGFGFPQSDAAGWFAGIGHENLRVLRRGDAVVGGLAEVPMAQWFGGRSVPTMGVAGVGVAPEERGRGVAVHMMKAVLREARARGFPLSTLYPASFTLYRAVGYERAGVHLRVSFDPRTIAVPRVPDVAVHELTGAPDDLRALYARIACNVQGSLDRGPYVWNRVVAPRGLTTKTFAFTHGGALEGYAVVAHVKSDPATMVTASDLCAASARAARAILRLLVEYRSVAQRVEYRSDLSDLVTMELPERHFHSENLESFMIRIVDVPRALELRGWPSWARGSLTLEVTDASLPENNGRWSVTIEDGKAHVGAAAGPTVAIGERGLAALYAGAAGPRLLVRAGQLEAGEEALERLDGWFSGPSPSLRDYF